MKTLTYRCLDRPLQCIALLVCALGIAACGSDEPPGLRVTVVDSSDKPVSGAVASIEKGGIYLENPDLTKGNPNFVLGARTDASGTFTLPVSPDSYGLHVFADGYRYGPREATVADELVEIQVKLAQELPADVQPVVSNVMLDPPTVAAGGQVTVRAMVAAGMVSDPSLAAAAKISAEVLLIAPALSLSFALDPPAPGCSDGSDPANPLGCPDGEFTKTFTAPSTKGTYTYYFVVSSEGCVTSDQQALSLVVE